MTDRKNTLYNAAVVLLCLALAGIIWYDRSHQNTQLSRWRAESAEQTRQELAYRERMRSAYRTYSERFHEALPGIVLWGDCYTMGERRMNLAYQVNLQIEKRLLGEINYFLTRGIRNFNFHSFRLDVVRPGSSLEDFDTIAARAGAGAILLAEDVQLPRRTDPVTVRLLNEEGKELCFAAGSERRFRRALIGDVEGYLYDAAVTSDGLVSRLAFGRKLTGRASQVLPAGTPVILEDATRYRGYPAVLFFGQTELLEEEEPARLIDRQKQIIEGLETGELYVVIGQCEEGSPLDREMAKAFENHYIRVSMPDLEQTDGKAFEELAARIYEKLDELGSFDGARQVITECLQMMV